MLRVKERKIYEMVSNGLLPVHRVTGKLLFPHNEIEEWIRSNRAQEKPGRVERAVSNSYPAVIAGGHDPLLEWALRESRAGIATLLDGAIDGLQVMQRGNCIAAGLHIPEPAGGWNINAAAKLFAEEPVVLVEWAKRQRGLTFRRGLGSSIETLASARNYRFQSRQAEAGSELVLSELLAREGLQKSDLHTVDSVARSETDLAMEIASGRADVGLGIAASARQFKLEFRPVIVERFDLLIWRRAFFDPPFQKLMQFCAKDIFKQRAQEMGGYDIQGFGTVHFNGA